MYVLKTSGIILNLIPLWITYGSVKDQPGIMFCKFIISSPGIWEKHVWYFLCTSIIIKEFPEQRTGILVVSSAEANPVDTLTQMGAQLQQMLTVSPAKLPKWFSPTVLRYHVLLHDNTDGNTPL